MQPLLTSCVSGEGGIAYFVVVVIGSLLTINWCFFVIYMAHAILRAALVARGALLILIQMSLFLYDISIFLNNSK